jgi:hypothetical protein
MKENSNAAGWIEEGEAVGIADGMGCAAPEAKHLDDSKSSAAANNIAKPGEPH